MTTNSKVQQIKAGYLPGLSDDEVQWHVLPFECNGTRLEVSVPMLTGAQMQALANRVRDAAAKHLRSMTVAQIIDVIDRAMAAPGDPISLDDLKIIVLMVYWSFGEEPDSLVLDELCDDVEQRIAH